MSRKTSVKDHEGSVGHDQSWLVRQRRREALDQIEEARSTVA
jgi:hypothetical protein